MTETHGKGLGLLANEFDVTSYNSAFNAAGTRQANNLSPFGSDDKTYLGGQRDGTYSIVGNWNDDAAADLEHASNMGLTVIYTVCPQGLTTAGNAAFLINGLQNSYGIPASTQDAVRHNLGGVSQNLFGGQLVHTLSAASVGDTASVDGGASSALGGFGHLHITAFTGTTITVTLEDSANDTTFATLGAFTAATGLTAERISFSGTVERYVRVNVAGTFSAVTLAVAFGRDV